MNYKYELIHADSKDEFDKIAVCESKKAKTSFWLLLITSLLSFAALVTLTTFIVKINMFFDKNVNSMEKDKWIDITYSFIALDVLVSLSFIFTLIFAVKNDLKLKDIKIMQKEYANKSNTDIWTKKIIRNKEEILMHKREIERLKAENEKIRQKIKAEEINKLIEETADVVEVVDEITEIIKNEKVDEIIEEKIIENTEKTKKEKEIKTDKTTTEKVEENKVEDIEKDFDGITHVDDTDVSVENVVKTKNDNKKKK